MRVPGWGFFGKLYSEEYYALFVNVSKQFREPIQYHSKTRPCCMAFSQMLPYGSCIKWNDSGSITFGLCFGIFCGMSLKSIWENISWDVQGKTKIGKMWVSEWRGWPLILLMRLGGQSSPSLRVQLTAGVQRVKVPGAGDSGNHLGPNWFLTPQFLSGTFCSKSFIYIRERFMKKKEEKTKKKLL